METTVKRKITEMLSWWDRAFHEGDIEFKYRRVEVRHPAPDWLSLRTASLTSDACAAAEPLVPENDVEMKDN